MNEIREPAAAGLFYPDKSDQLRKELDLLLSVSRPSFIPEKIAGIISPHAGYIYSGKTAAYAFNVLKDKNFKTVIIISPSHREYFAGISIYDGDAFETPLGVVPINKELRKSIAENSKFVFTGKKGHIEEHAIEVQIPFLQYVLKDFSIVPIVMGDQDEKYVDDLAEQIAKNFNDDIVIVASSDLSHYHTKETADKLDSVVERNISDFDYEQLLENLNNKICEACGGGPIVSMMKAAYLNNKTKSHILHRSDSSDTSGDTRQVVGYLSAVIYGE